MPAVRRGAAPSYTAIRRGATAIKEVRRGTVLKWSSAVIRDDFGLDGFLFGWINELCGNDVGQLYSDAYGNLMDGLGNPVGSLVNFVNGGVGEFGTLISGANTNLADAYCGIWGGTAPPEGLVGLVNGIPIIGPIAGGAIKTFLDLLSSIFGPNPDGTPATIESIIGKIPIVGELAGMIGLTGSGLDGSVLSDPINFVVDEAGAVLGSITCGVYTRETIAEAICYPIGIVGQAARVLVPDGAMSLPIQTSLFRFPTLLPGNDGWLETQIAQLGDAGYVTQLFRRYSNDGSGNLGVGLDLRDSVASIVNRVGGASTLVMPNLTSYGPTDVLRLVSAGTTHTLFKNGLDVGSWTGGTAGGAGNRSLAMLMQGAKEFIGARRFSPALNYIEAG